MPRVPLPTVFVSHGSPAVILTECALGDFLAGLGAEFAEATAVLCVSAHWETDAPAVSAAAEPATIHDFYGFPEALYQLSYPAPGAPDLARRTAALLGQAGLACGLDPARGLDHGAWAPLMMMFPDAGLPVAQLSVQPALGPRHHLRVGRALAALRDDGVLVLGSGGAVHNLGFFSPGSGAVEGWALRFDDWLADAVESGDADRLVDYRDLCADGVLAHPRDEHYLPLLVAAGAAGEGAAGRVLNKGFMDGSVGTAAYAFG